MLSPAQPNDQQQADDLLATQKMLRATLDASMDMIQVFQAVRNGQGQIIDFTWVLNNHAAQNAYGDVVGQSLLQLQPGVVEEGIFNTFKLVVETGEPQQYEKHYVHEQFDGWFYQSVVKLNDGVATTTADITSRKKAEQENLTLKEQIAQRAEDRYQALFDTIEEGLTIFEAIRDEAGQLIDLRYQALNRAMEQQTGLDRNAILGRKLSEVLPQADWDRWMPILAQVLASGEPVSFEEYVALIDRWYMASFYPRGGDELASFYRDITPRKRQEQQQHYLLQLADALRPLSDPKQVENTACRLLGEWLGVSSVYYCEIIEAEGIIRIDSQYLRAGGVPMPSQVPLDAYSWGATILGRGEAVVVADVHQSDLVPAELVAGMDVIGARSCLVVPLIKNGEWMGTLSVNDSEPRAWQAMHIEMTRETLERMWTSAQRARAEAALRQSEEKYRTLFESVDDGFCLMELVFNQSGRIADMIYREANAALAKHTGYSVTPGTLLSEFIAHIEPYWHDSLLRVHQTGVAERVEGYNADRGRWFSAQYSRVGGAGSKLIAAVFNDITERKQRELHQDFLLTFSDRLRVELTEDAIATCALQLLIEHLQLDRCYIAIYRLADDSAEITHQVGNDQVRPMPDAIRLSDFPQALRVTFDGTLVINNSTQEEGLSDTDRQNIDALGLHALVAATVRQGESSPHWVIVAVSAKPRHWTKGEIALLEEATERTWAVLEQAKAEEALRASQYRFESIANLVPDLLWDSWSDGTTTWYNQRWLEYTGQGYEQATGWGWAEAIHPDDRDASAKRYEETVSTGQSLRQEHRIRRHDGAYRWFVVSTSPFKDERGQVVNVYGAATDIDDLKRLEATLREADRRKDEFLAMLAHELRNPMSTLRSGLTILDLTITDELARSTVTMMDRQTDHLVRMVDDLLDVSRISRGKIELHKQRIDLTELVGQAIEGVQTQFEQQAKALQVKLPEGAIELEGDATRLHQVVVNLLTNGLRYTGEQGQVWLSLSHHNKEAILQVRDNGIGLAADQLPAIFELFVQVDNSTARSKGGLGLGLTLVKRLVEMHGGRVEAQSEGLGQGSIFTVHLPTLTAAAELMIKPAPQAPDALTAQRILVIDDNTDAGLMIVMLLKLKGYEAHTRSSGRTGIEAAESLQPEAILLDIGMPDLDGYATCRLIREQTWGQAMVIIALTGYGQEEDRQRTREAGFDGHLVKPVDLEALTKMLTDLLDKDQTNVGLA